MVDNSSLSYAFDPSYWNASTSNVIYTTGINTVPVSQIAGGWSEPTMTKAKQSPLDWLRGRIDEYVELGTLRE